MAEKLRSILSRTPWSLVIRAGAFAAAWCMLPFWAFTLVAFGLYLVPFFRPLVVGIPFAAMLALSWYLPSEPQISFFFSVPWNALVLGMLCYLILGIKDYAFIRRADMYEVLVALLLLVVANEFFVRTRTFEMPLWALGFGIVFFVLARAMLAYHEEGSESAYHREPMLRAATGIASLITAEWAWALLFLPFAPVYQNVLFFIGVVMLLEMLRSYGAHTLTRRSVLLMASVFAVILVVTLTANPWGI
jgi:hypothetical protein